MPDPLSDTVRTASHMGVGGPYSWRRRQLLVDARYQLRAGVLVGSVAIVLLVLLNASLVFQHRAPVGPVSIRTTTVRPPIAGQDGSSVAILIIGSLVFFGGVVLVGVLESHRTAGAAFAIRRAVDAIRDGHPQIRIRLRRGDHLQDVATAINQLAETIDAERLQRDRPMA